MVLFHCLPVFVMGCSSYLPNRAARFSGLFLKAELEEAALTSSGPIARGWRLLT